MKRKFAKGKCFKGKAVKGERRKSHRGYPAAVAAVVAAVLLSGCGGTDRSTAEMPAVSTSVAYDSGNGAAGGVSYDSAVYDMEYAEAESGAYDSRSAETPAAAPEEESNGTDPGQSQGRKLIKTVELEMETKEFEHMMSELETQIQELGGYIENLETYNGSSYSSHRSSRWANLTIRIPESALNGFLQNMSEIGNVVRRSDSVEDVTLTYVDMESRRDTLKAEQARLLELLEQAETVEDMIALEERLSDVRYYLESMESKLRTIDNRVDYSTVQLNLSEVKELTPVEEKTDLQRITEGFADSLKDIGNGIKESAIWFVIHIPYLVIWAAVIAALVLVLRKYGKKRREKKDVLKSGRTQREAPKQEQGQKGVPELGQTEREVPKLEQAEREVSKPE